MNEQQSAREEVWMVAARSLPPEAFECFRAAYERAYGVPSVDMSDKPKIFVWCNRCEPEWHSASAMAEDGTALGGHICSSHSFIAHDMGINENGWKRDIYAEHYPDGFEVVWVEDPKHHAGLDAAYKLNQQRKPEDTVEEDGS